MKLTIYKAVYQPPFSQGVINAIIDNCTVSITGHDGMGAQFLFKDLLDLIDKGQVDLTDKDQQIIDILKDKGVSYIDLI